MRFRLRPVLLFLSIFLVLTSPTLAGPLEDCAEYAQLGVPGQDGDILCRTGHLLAHDPVRKTPIWIAERLTAEKATSVQSGHLEHPIRFYPNGFSVVLSLPSLLYKSVRPSVKVECIFRMDSSPGFSMIL